MLRRMSTTISSQQRNRPRDRGAQNRKDVAASRDRDAKRGIVRVEVRIPAARRAEIVRLAEKWRGEI